MTQSALQYAQHLLDTDQYDALGDWVQNSIELYAQYILQKALQTNKWDAVDALLSNGKYSECHRNMLLRQAVGENNIPAARCLAPHIGVFALTAKHDEEGNDRTTPLVCAVMNNAIEIFDVLWDGDYVHRNRDEVGDLLMVCAEHRATSIFNIIVNSLTGPLENFVNRIDFAKMCMQSNAYEILDVLCAQSSQNLEIVLRTAVRMHSLGALMWIKPKVDPKKFNETIVSSCDHLQTTDLMRVFDVDVGLIQWNDELLQAILGCGDLDLFHKIVPDHHSYTFTARDYRLLLKNALPEEQVLDFLDLLVKHVDPNTTYALEDSIKHQKWRCVELLLPHCDLNNLNTDVLGDLAECRVLPLVDQICAGLGSSVPQKIFERAASKKNRPLLAHLLPHVNPRFNQSEALRAAAMNGDRETLEFLIPYSDIATRDFKIFGVCLGQDNHQDLLIPLFRALNNTERQNFKAQMGEYRPHAQEKFQQALNEVENEMLHKEVAALTPTQRRKKL